MFRFEWVGLAYSVLFGTKGVEGNECANRRNDLKLCWVHIAAFVHVIG